MRITRDCGVHSHLERAWFWGVAEPLAHEVRNNMIRPGRVEHARSEAVPACDDLAAADDDERDGLDIAWFEPDSRSCCNVEAFAICL